MATGAFVIEGGAENFNLKPKDIADPMPEDQRALSHGIYGAAGVLKLLKEQGVFKKEQVSLDEFRKRLLQVAETGLAASHVKSKLAATALEQIRDEIVLRYGRTIKFRYLSILAMWGAAGAVLGAVVVLVANLGVSGLTGYGWVLMGSMVGSWMSVAATRREIAFENMPNFLDSRLEPTIRMLFVGLLSVTLALFLQLNVLSLTVANIEFTKFSENIGVALLLGVVAGISEKALTVRLVKRAREVVVPAPS